MEVAKPTRRIGTKYRAYVAAGASVYRKVKQLLTVTYGSERLLIRADSE
jgi:hypothetical protein